MKKCILLFFTFCVFIIGHTQSWLLTGNAGTNPSTNFIGTTDANPLIFRINNEMSGKIDFTNHHTFFGYHSGFVTTGSDNTAFGYYALANNTTGSSNLAIGVQSMVLNTTGLANTAVGNSSLFSNSSGFANVAVGYSALKANTTGGYNVAVGRWALGSTSSGTTNNAVGDYALYSNTTGSRNIGIGHTASWYNKIGYDNIAMGESALYVNLNSANVGIGSFALTHSTNSQYNTALGYVAGSSYDNGYNNVFLGANTDVNGAGYYNVIAIGQATVCTNVSQVTIGNSASSSYRAYSNWTNISDGRFKKNVKEDVPGLDFIVKLRPVTYSLDATGLDAFLHKNVKDSISAEGKAVRAKAMKEKEQEIQMGFVAQEVEKTAKEMNLKISAVEAPHNENDVYGIRYAELVVPLVKAVQEQQGIIKQLQKDIADLKEQADLAVLLRETLINEKINAYPNPVANDMTVTVTAKSEGRGTLQVFNSGNQLVKEINITVNKGINTFGIKLPVLATGVYTLKVNWGKDMHKQMSFMKSN